MGFQVYIPRPAFCTDNAAMIAKAGEMKWLAGRVSPFTLTAVPNLAL
jgi:N6-L-threonylcarbamoyladenine synthase